MALPDKDEIIHHLGLSKLAGGALIVAWIAVWVAVAVVIGTTDYADAKELHWFEAFYRTGSIIFGGGQVVLPLLLKDVVQVGLTRPSRVDAAAALCRRRAASPPPEASAWVRRLLQSIPRESAHAHVKAEVRVNDPGIRTTTSARWTTALSCSRPPTRPCARATPRCPGRIPG